MVSARAQPTRLARREDLVSCMTRNRLAVRVQGFLASLAPAALLVGLIIFLGAEEGGLLPRGHGRRDGSPRRGPHFADGAGQRAFRRLRAGTRICRPVAFTAASPGQGGTGHINEQPAGYWTARFAARGYAPTPLSLPTAELSPHWGKTNVLAFREAGSDAPS